MRQEQKNLIVATFLSSLVLILWMWYYERPLMEQRQLQQVTQQQLETVERDAKQPEFQAGVEKATIIQRQDTPRYQFKHDAIVTHLLSRSEVLEQNERVLIENKVISGSVSLKGVRFDDLVLKKYKQSLDEDSDNVILLSPFNTEEQYFVDFGWVSSDPNLKLPTPNTIWKANKASLTDKEEPLILKWDNGEGLLFEMIISLDENYMLQVQQRITNASDNPIAVVPYGRINRHLLNDKKLVRIVHEGFVGVFNKALKEITYKDVKKGKVDNIDKTKGWLGIGDRYWLTAIIPDNSSDFDVRFEYDDKQFKEDYSVEFLGSEIIIHQGQNTELTNHLFVGAKETNLLDTYANELNIPLFDRAIDFGWLYLITKPMYLTLRFFNSMVHNFGIAIILLTIVVKIILLPLMNKSHQAMSKMRKLQPEIKSIREKHGDNKQEMNKAIMELYRQEKISPLSGMVPLFAQIPVFYALYKVLFITIDMRHAPFFGWIKDLSAPDPTSITNLFGLLPFEAPEFLHIGVLPIVMGLTMFLQQKLTPTMTGTNGTQLTIMRMLPFIFVFLFATFPAGLLIYWICSSLWSLVHQWLLIKKEER